LLSSRREKSKDGGRRRGCAGCEAGAGGAVQGPHDVVRRHDVPASAAPSSDTTSASQVITHPPLPLHAHRLRSFPLAWLKLSGRLLLLRVVPPPRANLQRRSFLGRPGYGARCLSRSGHSFASTFQHVTQYGIQPLTKGRFQWNDMSFAFPLPPRRMIGG
jgi:hypothetical protein